jgi:2-keto-4-pentenoate hydratase/2-oxohepta-3-ene-1,7-dioic acid hydratase in catechol pathway
VAKPRCVADDGTVAAACRFFTVKPGDVILTGTPSGVGCFRKPPLWLKAGDVVRCEIDGIGSITNPVVADTE